MALFNSELYLRIPFGFAELQYAHFYEGKLIDMDGFSQRIHPDLLQQKCDILMTLPQPN